MRAAVVRNGIVENIIEVEPESDWQAPKGPTLIVAEPDAPLGIGWSVDKGRIVEPPPPPNDPEPTEVTKGDAISALIKAAYSDEKIDLMEQARKEQDMRLAHAP